MSNATDNDPRTRSKGSRRQFVGEWILQLVLLALTVSAMTDTATRLSSPFSV